jgi:hypothetical protein
VSLNAPAHGNERAGTGKDYRPAYIFVAILAALLLLVGDAASDAATLSAEWNPNSEPDLAGYVLSYGSSSGHYTTTIDVGNRTTYSLSLDAGQTYYFAVQAYNADGVISPYSSEVAYAIPPSNGLPVPWQATDVGAVGLAGSAGYASGVFTVLGAGSDIWGPADAFQFVHQPLTGDGQIVARVTSESSTGAHAKAGVMLRSTVSPSSAHVILDVQPDGSIEFMTRPGTNSATSYIAGATSNIPVWLKLTRSGNMFNGFRSADGITWTLVGQTSVALAPSVEAGLAVTSHSILAPNVSTFENVAPTGSVTTSPPAIHDVVVYAADVPAASVHGAWSVAAAAGAAGGVALTTPDTGVAQTASALSNPSDYIDVPFTAEAGVPYTFWIRLRAANNSKYNDSLWVQFSDAHVGTTVAYPIGSATGLLVNLATTAEASSLHEWGWTNSAYWLQQPATVTFATTGSHVVRIQVREDGVQLDQIVLSAGPYLSAPPGPVSGDATVVPK